MLNQRTGQSCSTIRYDHHPDQRAAVKNQFRLQGSATPGDAVRAKHHRNEIKGHQLGAVRDVETLEVEREALMSLTINMHRVWRE